MMIAATEQHGLVVRGTFILSGIIAPEEAVDTTYCITNGIWQALRRNGSHGQRHDCL